MHHYHFHVRFKATNSSTDQFSCIQVFLGVGTAVRPHHKHGMKLEKLVMWVLTQMVPQQYLDLSHGSILVSLFIAEDQGWAIILVLGSLWEGRDQRRAITFGNKKQISVQVSLSTNVFCVELVDILDLKIVVKAFAAHYLRTPAVDKAEKSQCSWISLHEPPRAFRTLSAAIKDKVHSIIIQAVNFIKASVVNTRLFAKLCMTAVQCIDMDSNHETGVLYTCSVAIKT